MRKAQNDRATVLPRSASGGGGCQPERLEKAASAYGFCHRSGHYAGKWGRAWKFIAGRWSGFIL